MKAAMLALVLACAGASQAAHAADRPEPVVLRAAVKAPPPAVWEALTTPKGVRTFFAPQALVEPRIGGAYEMYFSPDNPPGLKGGEGVRILAMEPPSRFLFSWNAPPVFGPLRPQQTWVEIELAPAEGGKTALTLTHAGWGRGGAWRKVRDYFATAWPNVLGRLQYLFAEGPVDWRRPPDGAAYFTPARP